MRWRGTGGARRRGGRSRGPALAVLPLLLASLLVLIACRGEPEPARNLVLVVIDTLRADRVGSYGAERETTPALDAFGRQALRFERAYSAAPWTQPAMASIFTGLAPSGHGLVYLGQPLPRTLPTLPELLQSHGFATGAVVSHVLVGREYGFARGFERFDQEAAGGHEAISSPRVTERAIAMLEALEAGGSRFFLFVHYFDPHYSYQHHPGVGFAPEQRGRVKGGAPIELLWRLEERIEPAELAQVRALYDEEIRFTDDSLARLLAALRRSGRLEDSVVVVTADHGEEFLERTRIGHAASLYDELLRVPLWIAAPGRPAGVVASPVSTAALAPTLLELLGLPSSLRPGARSFAGLLSGAAAEEAPPVFAETRHFANKRAIVDGRHKLVLDRQGGPTELYDLRRDPGERENLAAREPEQVARLGAALEAHLERQRALGTVAPAPRLDAEERELLRGLGYLREAEAGAGAKAEPDGRPAAGP